MMMVKAEGAAPRLAVGLPCATAIQPPTEEPQPSSQQVLLNRRRCGLPEASALGYLGPGANPPKNSSSREGPSPPKNGAAPKQPERPHLAVGRGEPHCSC